MTNPKAPDALPVDASASAPLCASAQQDASALSLSPAAQSIDAPLSIASQVVAPQAASLFDAVVSGAFDLEDADVVVPEPRRILQPQAETP